MLRLRPARKANKEFCLVRVAWEVGTGWRQRGHIMGSLGINNATSGAEFGRRVRINYRSGTRCSRNPDGEGDRD